MIIDGSYGEGGGQILRTSLSIAAILHKPVKIINIRAGRQKPGLQPQHLTAARAVMSICNGRLIGDAIGSQTLEFHPGTVKPGHYTFDVSQIKASAGSVTLIFQTVLIPLALASGSSKVTIRGGTHVPMSPSVNYIEDVYLPVLSRMGIYVHFRIVRAGYYPIGRGEIVADIRPVASIKPISFTDRPDGVVTCLSAVSNLPISIAHRQANEAVDCLQSIGVTCGESIEDYDSQGKGTVTFLLFSGGEIKAGFSALGERGKPAEKVAREACDEFSEWWKSGKAIDKHLADQLIVPMALADGESSFTTVEHTRHLSTNIWTVGHFLPAEISIEGEEGQAAVVTVKGSNFRG